MPKSDAALQALFIVSREILHSFHDIRFVPSNEASLQAMFEAMSKCQSLHPDPADSGDDDGEEVEGEEEEEEGMYDDAEEEEEEGEGEGEGAEEGDGSTRPSNGGGTEEPMDQ